MSPKVRDTLRRPGRTKRGFRETANFFTSERTKNDVLLIILSGLLIMNHSLNSLSLIDPASMVHNALTLALFVWSMVSRKNKQFLAACRGHDSSTVSYIRNIALTFNQKDNYCTGSWLIIRGSSLISIICNLEKLSFCSDTPVRKCLSRISRKAILIYNYSMQTFFEEISTCTPSMPIINCKIRALRPFIWWLKLFALRSSHIQNYWNSILIVTSLDSLMSICCIWYYQTVSFWGKFGALKALQWILKMWDKLLWSNANSFSCLRIA